MSELQSHERWTNPMAAPVAALIRSTTAPAKSLPTAPPAASQRTLVWLVTLLIMLGTAPLLVGWIAGQLLR